VVGNGSAAFELRGASVVYGGRSALVLNASIRPTRGQVCLDRRDLASLSPAELRSVRARIGFVHQDLALVPNLRVSQNVMAGKLGSMTFESARAMLFPPRQDLERAAAILHRVGIGEKLFQRTDSLSGGQRQRVAIARALFQEPLALLADEPVSSVDPARARDTVSLLREVCAERKLTLLVSLHDLELAREFFPRLVGLREGAVAFDRRTAELGPAEFAALYRLDGTSNRSTDDP
jgi:phosphonate transport system ATP-binding protein